MEDLNNQKFTRWAIVKYIKTVNRNAIWLCQCDCGNYGEVSCHNLKRGASKSCGCLKKEFALNQFRIFVGAVDELGKLWWKNE